MVAAEDDAQGVPSSPRRFLVVALILGPYLPDRLVEGADGVRFGPISEEAAASLPKERGVVGSVYDKDQLYNVRAPYMQVNSSRALFITVDATDANAAQERAKTAVLPDLIAALHTLGNTPYRVELVRVLDQADKDSARATPLLDMGSFGYVSVEPLTARRRQTLWRRRAAIGADATATAAAYHLRLGVTLGDYPDTTGVAAAAAAVLRYNLCIERIVQAVTAEHRKERRGELDGAKSDLADKFVAQIAERSGADAVAAIEAAARELRAVDLRFADLEIREAASILDVDQATTDEAVRLNEFRAKHLAHSSVPPEELVRAWIAGPDNRAFRTAAKLLGAYLDRLDNRGNPGAARRDARNVCR